MLMLTFYGNAIQCNIHVVMSVAIAFSYRRFMTWITSWYESILLSTAQAAAHRSLDQSLLCMISTLDYNTWSVREILDNVLRRF